jgi:hypothetical protein
MPREDWCPDLFEWNGYEVKEGSEDACYRFVPCDEIFQDDYSVDKERLYKFYSNECA